VNRCDSANRTMGGRLPGGRTDCLFPRHTKCRIHPPKSTPRPMVAGHAARVWMSLFAGMMRVRSKLLRGCQADNSETISCETCPTFPLPVCARNASREPTFDHYTPVLAILILRVFTSLHISTQFVKHLCAWLAVRTSTGGRLLPRSVRMPRRSRPDRRSTPCLHPSWRLLPLWTGVRDLKARP
jgi:hypothetical protein